ncbi:helix-turn-helix domain-containing protein [Pannonibacter tanglangensis]|uniref:Response regulatory domain-containing protein n=1 Tax=Pannonibacter tanglangensis TaxID=2750084 RepID=A0ABW9ZJK7_9HYPH|nr:response regulator transcription factor [Pannonibacter sp. XCT-34]NBN65082.1 hypothetical protein [Pannonibacter sp. XCT-34]
MGQTTSDGSGTARGTGSSGTGSSGGTWRVTLVSDDPGLAVSLSALLARAPEARLSVVATADALAGLRRLPADVVLLDADSLPDVARLAGVAVLIQPAPVAVTGLSVTPGSQGHDLCRSRGASLIHAKTGGTADPLLAGPAGDALLSGLGALAAGQATGRPVAPAGEDADAGR